ncbi:ABC transporter permease [Rossellomorea aquimaris]|uniref:ABC transporter permease n=1 Tax=Rossellomorea aquimaris TaxID=189382 RepID=UPI001CD6CAA8|nr:ABC transporter permease subunit [Rossellomorea aquimaris]MCA1054494.1 ABC transporter permease [Rossellomorea aquimaris]
MKIAWVLFRKEMKESARNFKWIWMPIVFMIIGLTEPLTAYYLPDILDSIGDLPDGAVIEIPPPSSPEILMSTIGQFNTLGVLLIVLSFMSTISGERKNGTAAMVLVKPVSYHAYIYSKWAGSFVLLWVSYLAGMVSSWYYINLLFEDISADRFFQSLFVYGVWLTFILTMLIFFSSLVKASGLAAFSTIAISLVLSFISGTLPEAMKWSPSRLSSYVADILNGLGWSGDLNAALMVTGLVCILLLFLTPHLFRKKELT